MVALGVLDLLTPLFSLNYYLFFDKAAEMFQYRFKLGTYSLEAAFLNACYTSSEKYKFLFRK